MHLLPYSSSLPLICYQRVVTQCLVQSFGHTLLLRWSVVVLNGTAGGVNRTVALYDGAATQPTLRPQSCYTHPNPASCDS